MLVAVCPKGALDHANASFLDPLIAALAERGATRVVLDLSEISFIGSRSVGHILSWSSLLASRSGKLVLSSVPESAREVLDLVGANRFLTTARNLKEALDSLSGGHAAASR